MAKVIEVYPKIGCIISGDPSDFRWISSMRQTTKARIVGIFSSLPGVTIDSWHVHEDEGDIGSNHIRTPKIVVTLTVPDATTHADIVQAFDVNGYWPWIKGLISNRLRPAATVVEWQGKLMTSMGRSQIDEAP